MTDNQPYEKQWWMIYFNREITEGVLARFKKNIFTRAIYVFQANYRVPCNRWNEPGYGWGYWRKL
jgi:hypothetical protein